MAARHNGRINNCRGKYIIKNTQHQRGRMITNSNNATSAAAAAPAPPPPLGLSGNSTNNRNTGLTWINRYLREEAPFGDDDIVTFSQITTAHVEGDNLQKFIHGFYSWLANTAFRTNKFLGINVYDCRRVTMNMLKRVKCKLTASALAEFNLSRAAAGRGGEHALLRWDEGTYDPEDDSANPFGY